MSGHLTAFDRRLPDLRRRQIRRIAATPWQGVPEAGPALGLLRECLGKNDRPLRRRLLRSPLLGGWIHDVLFWAEARRLAEALRGGRGTSRIETSLFDRIARTEFLTEIVPSGRLDPGFASRARARALRCLRERMGDLPRILVPYLPARGGGRHVRLFFRTIPDEGCPAGRIRLGESPITLVWRRGGPPESLRVRREGRVLFIPSPAEVVLQETIPGTSILLSHRLVSGADSMRVGSPVPGLGRRLARALAAVDAAWPEAGLEIRRRTWMLVPLLEPGTVSYSQMARPGISYINVFRGSLLDLADDLLHETAHHRLHAWQEVEDFIHDPEETRYYSPWRRSLRPLHGILHGTFTFLFRAELFLRILRSSGEGGRSGGPSAAGRRRLAAEVDRETANCSSSLEDLREAAGRGLLTAAGKRLVARMRRRLRALKKGRLPGRGLSGIL